MLKMLTGQKMGSGLIPWGGVLYLLLAPLNSKPCNIVRTNDPNLAPLVLHNYTSSV